MNEATIGATAPLNCQKRFAMPVTLPANSPPILDTAVEFAGVIINLIKPMEAASIISGNSLVITARSIVDIPYNVSNNDNVFLTPRFLIM